MTDTESKVQEVMRLVGEYAGWVVAMNMEGGSAVSADFARATLESAVRALAAPQEQPLGAPTSGPGSPLQPAVSAAIPDAAVDDGCICQGNWRAIIAESTPRFGHYFRGQDNDLYRFEGVVHAEDDYYYLMRPAHRPPVWLSCVGSIETHGFVPTDPVGFYSELDHLRAFRDYFKDHCEELFAHFGMGPVHLFNATRPYGDGAPLASES